MLTIRLYILIDANIAEVAEVAHAIHMDQATWTIS